MTYTCGFPQLGVVAEQVAAEAERQKIRDKYAAMQEQIDAAQTAEELLAVMPKE